MGSELPFATIQTNVGPGCGRQVRDPAAAVPPLHILNRQHASFIAPDL